MKATVTEKWQQPLIPQEQTVIKPIIGVFNATPDTLTATIVLNGKADPQTTQTLQPDQQSLIPCETFEQAYDVLVKINGYMTKIHVDIGKILVVAFRNGYYQFQDNCY